MKWRKRLTLKVPRYPRLNVVNGLWYNGARI